MKRGQCEVNARSMRGQCEVNAHLHIELILCCARPIKNLSQKLPSATTKNSKKTNQNQFDLTYFRYLLDPSLNKLKSLIHLSDLVSA